MKKLSVLIGLLAAAGTGHAQRIAAGTVSLTGSIGYNTSTNTNSSTYPSINGGGPVTYTNKTTSSQFGLAASPAYFVADNLALGLNLGYNVVRGTQKITTTNNPGVNPVALPDLDPNSLVRVGAFIQYYKLFSEQFGVVGTLGGGYQHAKSHTYNGNSTPMALTYTGNGYYAELTPGIVFFPIPKIGISASIGSLALNHFSNDYPEGTGSTAPTSFEDSSNSFGASFGFDHLVFGGTYYFGR